MIWLRVLLIAYLHTYDAALARTVADDITSATSDEWSAVWLAHWSYRESGYNSAAVDVTGLTHGSMQVHAGTWGTPPRDRVGQYEQALEILAILHAKCGSRRKALNAYATGKCDKNTTLVTFRCKEIGSCDGE